jgi:hypothetical protein
MQYYEGDFKNDKFHGAGNLINNGEIYEGEFIEGVKCGFGKIYYKNGEKFEGQMIDNKRNGIGNLYKKNGEIFEGKFENDLRKGEGTLTYLNGCKLFGIWDDTYNNFEGKFFGNVGDRREFNFCKILKERLIEKSEKIWDKENFLGSDLELIEIEFEGKIYEIILNKIS